MVIEHVIPKDPRAFPEHRWIAGQNRVCCTKAGRGKERNI